jgi:hypothetical protein
MSGLALNIALLLLGTAATLAAFGGDTWVKGDTPLIKRITPRGFASLFCLIGALVLGVTKEIQSTQAEQSLIAQRDSERSALRVANQKLDRLELVTAQQATANLLAILSGGSIEEGYLDVRLKKYSSEKSRFEYLFPNLPARYQEIAHIEIQYDPYASMDGECELRPGKDSRFSCNSLGNQSDGDAGKGGFSINTKLPSYSNQSAALAYSDISSGHRVVMISLVFSKIVNTKAETKLLQASFPELKISSNAITLDVHNRRVNVVEFEVPKSLQTSFIKYWNDNFESGESALLLRGSSLLTLNSKLKFGGEEMYFRHGVTVKLIPDGLTPSVEVVSHEEI